jgi:hypothetical protein
MNQGRLVSPWTAREKAIRAAPPYTRAETPGQGFAMLSAGGVL